MKIKNLLNKKLVNGNLYSIFCFEPLDFGMGLSLGTFLRRILLNNITGTSVTAVKFLNSNILDSSFIPGIQEDIFEICSNLTKIILHSKLIKPCKGILEFSGPGIIDATSLKIPKFITILNPEQYIAVATDGSNMKLELLIEQGKGFKFAKSSYFSNKLEDFIFLNSSFNPVLKVNFKVKAKTFNSDISLKKQNKILKESLHMELWTNGSITPKRALMEAYKININIFNYFFN